MYYVIEAVWTNGNLYGYVTGTGKISRNPDEARKFSLPADGECWIESHRQTLGMRNLATWNVVKLAVAEEPEPILA